MGQRILPDVPPTENVTPQHSLPVGYQHLMKAI
jgi:hypothetical protein